MKFKHSDFFKFVSMLAVLGIMVTVTGLVGQIATNNGLTEDGVRHAMLITLLITASLGMAGFIFAIIRINLKIKD